MMKTVSILRSLIREQLLAEDRTKGEPKTHKSRFFCPRNGAELVSRYSERAGKFWGCPEYPDCDYTVEGDPPHRAYGNTAKDFNMEDGRPYFGRPQEPQLVPTKRHATAQDRAQKYYDLLSMNLEMSTDFRQIRNVILPQVHKMGLKKKTIDDIRNDMETIRSKGQLG